jgi:hypothetical protein
MSHSSCLIQFIIVYTKKCSPSIKGSAPLKRADLDQFQVFHHHGMMPVYQVLLHITGMNQTEGVIKYTLEYSVSAPPADDLTCLNSWRSILHELHLVGQSPDLYQGYGYGNLSQRRSSETDEFVITASQTGQYRVLTAEQYVAIEDCCVERNRVRAKGAMPPSSEAMSHAIIYQLSPATQCVMHIHDQRLWHYALENDMPATGSQVEFGTVSMAQEIERLMREAELVNTGLLAMAGHEDGLISFGDSVNQAGFRLLKLWLAARGYL